MSYHIEFITKGFEFRAAGPWGFAAFVVLLAACVGLVIYMRGWWKGIS